MEFNVCWNKDWHHHLCSSLSLGQTCRGFPAQAPPEQWICLTAEPPGAAPSQTSLQGLLELSTSQGEKETGEESRERKGEVRPVQPAWEQNEKPKPKCWRQHRINKGERPQKYPNEVTGWQGNLGKDIQTTFLWLQKASITNSIDPCLAVWCSVQATDLGSFLLLQNVELFYGKKE